jgi:hypothetical protein
LKTWRSTIFSTDGVSGVKNLNTCILDFCVVSVVWPHSVHCSLLRFLIFKWSRFYFWAL